MEMKEEKKLCENVVAGAEVSESRGGKMMGQAGGENCAKGGGVTNVYECAQGGRQLIANG